MSSYRCFVKLLRAGVKRHKEGGAGGGGGPDRGGEAELRVGAVVAAVAGVVQAGAGQLLLPRAVLAPRAVVAAVGGVAPTVVVARVDVAVGREEVRLGLDVVLVVLRQAVRTVQIGHHG